MEPEGPEILSLKMLEGTRAGIVGQDQSGLPAVRTLCTV